MVPLSTEETYVIIVQEAQKLADAKYGSIFIYKNKKLNRVYSSVPPEFQLEPRKRGYTFKSFSKREAFVVSTEIIRKFHPTFQDKKTKKMIFIPLSYEQDSLGVITLDSSHRKNFSSHDLKVLQLFGSLASTKIRNAMLVAELKASLETRDTFISMASHELKTPLTAISGYIQLIDRTLQNKKEVKTEWVKNLSLSSERMTRLIDELLHVNRIRMGKMTYQFKPIDLEKVIRQALKDFSVSYPNQIVKFKDLRQDTSALIWGDRNKLVQVVVNLLNNAAKFSEKNTAVQITLQNLNKKYQVTIEDRGLGIAAEDLGHLFEEFYKTKADTREGLGLGLFISKKILEAHKGKVILKSQLNQGTTVSFVLPTTPSHAQ